MRYVYVVRNLINGKVYVGQTRDPKGRKAGHWCAGRNGYKHPLYHSMRKHGINNFSFEILEECADDIINEREKFWIAHFDSFNPEKGYNLTSGGEEGKVFSQESREKIRLKALLKRNSPETRRKISEGNKGKHHLTDEKRKRSGHPGMKNPMFNRKGERHPRSKLSQQQANEIRNRPELAKIIAKEFHVSPLTIRRIRNGEIYNG